MEITTPQGDTPIVQAPEPDLDCDGAGVAVDVDGDGRLTSPTDFCEVQPAGPIQTGGGGTLPRTGADGLAAVVAAALLATGVGIVAWTRRRGDSTPIQAGGGGAA